MRRPGAPPFLALVGRQQRIDPPTRIDRVLQQLAVQSGQQVHVAARGLLVERRGRVGAHTRRTVHLLHQDELAAPQVDADLLHVGALLGAQAGGQVAEAHHGGRGR
jgi:hypothetical protein